MTTLAQAQAKLTEALDAYSAAMYGSFSAGEFSGTPPSVGDATRAVDYWQSKVNELTQSATGRGVGARGKWAG